VGVGMKYRIVQDLGEGQLVVHNVDEENLAAFLEVRNIEVLGEHKSKSTRPELQGQPKLKGFCGPMWDDGCIRYEDQKSYNILSGIGVKPCTARSTTSAN
jgi:hypothetical protein